VSDDSDTIMDKLQRLCASAVQSLSASGAGVSLIGEDGTHNAASASDPATENIEELQFTLGEGPCVDAFVSRRPVLVPDLADGAMSRWPLYAPAVYETGVRAVFAFPLQIGAARLGVLDVLRTRSGMLTDEETTSALAIADIAVHLLLDSREHATPDTDGLDGVVEDRAQLFQAQGMVMVQLGVTLAEAMVRIRAHAFGEGRRLHDIAADIVARRLRFDPDERFDRDGS
jgi:hypothetical protein